LHSSAEVFALINGRGAALTDIDAERRYAAKGFLHEWHMIACFAMAKALLALPCRFAIPSHHMQWESMLRAPWNNVFLTDQSCLTEW
jgi:hypothetical protein